jgi:gamma-glutamyltranspeptidase / glutathione hydrolase
MITMMGPAAGQDRDFGRSMVISRNGIVATAHVQASVAGARMLERGGSAVDAAIAANAVLSVTEMMMNGMGGDLFAMYWDAGTGRLTGINASGPAPAGLTAETVRRATPDGKMPGRGIHTVTVPGAVDGWAKMHARFGKLPWADLFQPAIYYAENGYPVPELIQAFWAGMTPVLEADEQARRIYLPGGKPPRVGQVFRNPDLGRALRLLATGGRDAFYKGEIARAILASSERLGGTMTTADLSGYSAEFVEPVATTYRGWKVWEMPPNGMGIGALAMLNLMERFPIGTWAPASPEAFHVKIEAQKLAYEDMRSIVADPRTRPPVGSMLDKSYAARRAGQIDMARAHCEPRPGVFPTASRDTTYLSVVDRDGNIVTWIQSISEIFGSGIVPHGMGFHLHNRGASFSLDPRSPNFLEPGKRPFHTIIPGFLEKGGVHIGFGIMSGLNQATAHAQFVSHIVDHGMNLQQAMEAARFTKRDFGGCGVEIENRVPAETRAALEAKGHRVKVLGAYSARTGGGQAVMHDSEAKVNYGASSPRKDGAAVPEAEFVKKD